MSMQRIASRSNPTFQRLRKLATDARARQDEQRTMLEGDHLAEAWLARSLPAELCAVDVSAIGNAAIDRCVQLAHARGIPVIALEPALMTALSSVESPARLTLLITPISGDLQRAHGQDIVLLDRVQDPGNVGAILRTAAAAGIEHVIAGPGCAAIWSPKVLRAAMGGHAWLNVVAVEDLMPVVADLKVRLLATSSHADASLYQTDLRPPTAWLFGHEGQGVSAQLLQRVERTVSIPQTSTIESLNVAAAAAVCLFEMRRQRLAA